MSEIQLNIQQELISINANDIPNNIIAAATFINDTGMAEHAGIFVKYNNTPLLLHWFGKDILFEKVDPSIDSRHGWYFHKKFVFSLPRTISSFIVHCNEIKEESNPQYGYFYPGSYYDSNGKYYNDDEENRHPEYMTCVGFCLNVIKGFIEQEDYIQYRDWTAANSLDDEYLANTIKIIRAYHPDISVEEISENARRIKPVEYLAAAFSENIPVTKKYTDSIIEEVQQILSTKRRVA